MPRIFDTIAIVGVGLIGGSLGMAAKRRGLAERVIGVGRTENKLMQAKILAAIDDYSLDLDKGVSEADLVIVCTPVRQVAKCIEVFAHSLKPGAIVTDVGSTKSLVVQESTAVIPNRRHFIGGHPMAGTEKTGVEFAFPEMFAGATYVLTPTDDTDLAALAKLSEFVDAIGACLETMSPQEHDKAVAMISHLPHVMSASLLNATEQAQRTGGKTLRLAAGSFRDLTRISDSPPELWRDICLTNSGSIVNAIDGLSDFLGRFRDALVAQDEAGIEELFEQARQIRQTYLRINQ